MKVTKDGKHYLNKPGIKLTKEEFIKKVENIHNNIFEFDKMIYKNLNSDIIVKCKQHNYFNIKAKKLLNKQIFCSECKKETLLKQCILKYGERFEYDYNNFKNIDSLIVIFCKKHNNKYNYSLRHHLTFSNGGCKICKKENLHERYYEKLINNSVYKLYNFSLSKLSESPSTTNIEIYCNKHKINFFKNLGYILGHKTQLCPECINEYKINNFIKIANNKHKNKYDYDEIKKYGSDIKLPIICPIHGRFEQLPQKHLEIKDSCPTCSGDIYQIRNTEDFIIRAKTIHGDKYDYSGVNYINTKTTVDIICKYHGLFKQRPSNHISMKQGCSKCNKSYRISTNQVKWLNEHRVPLRSYIVSDYNVDGFNDITKTVYEFLGDYWHGNLERYTKEEMNITVGKTFGELNIETFDRLEYLKSQGYNIIYIWERDWLNGKSSKTY